MEDFGSLVLQSLVLQEDSFTENVIFNFVGLTEEDVVVKMVVVDFVFEGAHS